MKLFKKKVKEEVKPKPIYKYYSSDLIEVHNWEEYLERYEGNEL